MTSPTRSDVMALPHALRPAEPRARRPLLELVGRPRVSPRRRRRRMAVASVALVGVVLFLIIVVHVRTAQTAFELKAERTRLALQGERHERLRLAVANLEAPGRVRAEAQDRLGMVAPTVVHYVEVGEVDTGDDGADNPSQRPAASRATTGP